MTARILDGRALATELRGDLASRVDLLRARGIAPRLVAIMVGEDESNLSYVRGMKSLGAKIGVDVSVDALPPGCDDAAVRAALERHGEDDAAHGIILQQPLPRGLSMRAIATAMPEHKDVDGASPVNAGRLAASSGARFAPATPTAVMLLLERSAAWPLAGRDVVVLGRSNVIGMPAALLLVARDATVTIAHSKTRDVREIVRRADVLVAAVGRPKLVDASWLRPGCVVVDVGTTVVDGKLFGDVDFESASTVAAEITPVPGGVGPVTNVVLMRHVVEAAEAGGAPN